MSLLYLRWALPCFKIELLKMYLSLDTNWRTDDFCQRNECLKYSSAFLTTRLPRQVRTVPQEKCKREKSGTLFFFEKMKGKSRPWRRNTRTGRWSWVANSSNFTLPARFKRARYCKHYKWCPRFSVAQRENSLTVREKVIITQTFTLR